MLAKGGALQYAYGVDDWAFALRSSIVREQLAQARFGGAGLSRLLQGLNGESVHSPLAWVAVLIAVQALFGALIARHWHLERRVVLGIAAASLIAIHPYTCESLHLRSAIAHTAVSQGLLLLLLIPQRWTVRRLAAGAVVFAAALSLYQLMLHYLVMAAIVGSAVAWGRYLRFAGRHGWSDRVRRVASWRRILRHKVTALWICAVGGTALYGVATLLYLWRFPVVLTSRTKLLALDVLRERARQVAHRLAEILIGQDPLVTRLAQGILLALLGLALVGLVRWLRRGAVLRSSAAAGAAALGLGAGLIWSLGMTLVIQEFWPAPRIVAPIAIVSAGALALASLLNGRLVRRVSLAGALIVLLSFIGTDNRIFSEQVRLNQRDRLTANRIVERLENAPGFAAQLPVVVHGTRWRYPLALRTTTFDLNISAFGAPWSKVEVLREVSGYALSGATSAQKAAAAEYCGTVEVFPAPTSVVVRDGLGIVCLEK